MDLTNLIPEGADFVGFVASVAYIDQHGRQQWRNFTGGSVHSWDARDMALSAANDIHQHMVDPTFERRSM